MSTLWNRLHLLSGDLVTLKPLYTLQSMPQIQQIYLYPFQSEA